MIKAWQTVILVLIAANTVLAAESSELPAVQRIYTRCDWGLSFKGPHKWSGYGWSTPSTVLRGSFWIAQRSSRPPLIVTAYHNLKPYSALVDVKTLNYLELATDQRTVVKNSKVLDNEWNILRSLTVSSKLTSLGHDIISVGQVAEIGDLVLLRANPAAFLGMKRIKLAGHPPQEGEKVIAVGLPGDEPLQKRVSAEVNIVQGRFFTINIRLDDGFSGGVVLNENGEAYGFISTVTEKATTVYILSEETLGSAKWLSYAPIAIQ